MLRNQITILAMFQTLGWEAFSITITLSTHKAVRSVRAPSSVGTVPVNWLPVMLLNKEVGNACHFSEGDDVNYGQRVHSSAFEPIAKKVPRFGNTQQYRLIT